MIVTYDPEVQGRKLSENELKRLMELKPEHTSFSIDEPELTEELVKRMKRSSHKQRPDMALNVAIQ